MQTWRETLSDVPADPEQRLRQANAARSLRREKRKVGVQALRLLTPEQRFGAVIDALAEERRESGVHVDEIAAAHGAKFPTRGHGHASVREVAAALRAKGWKRIRQWRGGADSGFSTRWFPPESA